MPSLIEIIDYLVFTFHLHIYISKQHLTLTEFNSFNLTSKNHVAVDIGSITINSIQFTATIPCQMLNSIKFYYFEHAFGLFAKCRCIYPSFACIRHFVGVLKCHDDRCLDEMLPNGAPLI